MKILIILPLILLAILPAVFPLPWTGVGQNTVVKPTQAFDGCYSDTSSQVLGKNGVVFKSDTNINANCAITCKQKGFAVASTKRHTCYCTNSLPYPQLFPANDSRAAGKSGPCRITCPGVWTENDCQFDECCGGEGAYSVFIVDRVQIQRQPDIIMQLQRETIAPKHSQYAHAQEVGKFDGCYSDEQVNVLGGVNGKAITWDDNFNIKCQGACQEEGYAIASTKGEHCYCTNSLPLPQLHRADNKLSAGNGGPCSTVCPGVFVTHSCQGDECCGGENAVSVYIIGEIDALKQLQRRVIKRVLGNARAKNQILDNEQLTYYIKEQWKTEMNGNECQLNSEVLTKFGQIDLKYEILSHLSKDDNNVAIQIAAQQQLNRQCTYKRIKYTLDFKTAIHLYDLNDMYVYVIDGYSSVYYDRFKSYELTGRAGSGFSIYDFLIFLFPKVL